MTRPTSSNAAGRLFSTRILTTLAELEEVRPLWVTLQRHPNSDLDFYLAILRVRRDVISPYVIVLYRDGNPQALLVGRLERRRLDFRIGYKRIASPAARSLTFIYEGFLGEQSPEYALAIFEAIRSSLQRGHADLAVMNFVRTGSPLHSRAMTLAGPFRFVSCASPQPHKSIVLPKEYSQFLMRLSAKTRMNRRNEASRLHRGYPNAVSIQCLGSPLELDRIFTDAEAIARSTYHRGLGVGFVDSEENRQRLSSEASKGRLRAYFLYLKDRPAAFFIGTMYGDTFHGTFTGFDPAYRRSSPGMYLILAIIESLCRDGVARFDFGFGDAWYKEQLCDAEWQEASIFVYAPSTAGVRLRLLHGASSVVNQVATRVLVESGLILKAKRAWRKLYIPNGAEPAGGEDR